MAQQEQHQQQYDYSKNWGIEYHVVPAPRTPAYAKLSPGRAEHSKGQRKSIMSLPWAGLAGLVIALLSVAASIALLFWANGKATDSWPMESTSVQLAVVLAIPVTIGSAALRMAFHEGVTVSWWVKAHKGASFKDIHDHWEHGASSLEAIKGLRNGNRVTIPSILLLGLLASGPLFQRAAEIRILTSMEPRNFDAMLSTGEFNQPTGYYMDHAPVVKGLSRNFSQVVQEYTNRDPITLNLKGCKGRCVGTAIAAGFDVSCTRENKSYNLTVQGLQVGDELSMGYIRVEAAGAGNPGVTRVFTMYKSSPDTTGKLTMTNCTLHAAQIRYPFEHINGTATLQGMSTTVDGTVNRTVSLWQPSPEPVGLNLAKSAWGGIALAIDDLYGSSVVLRYAGKFAVQGSGPMKYAYMSSNDSVLGEASMTWTDPTPLILEAIREITFRTAIAFSDNAAHQAVEGYQYRSTPTYSVDNGFLGGALVLIILNFLAIAVLFWGMTSLGRSVSLSPLEIARAFDAPRTRKTDLHAPLSEKMKHIGDEILQLDPPDNSYGMS